MRLSCLCQENARNQKVLQTHRTNSDKHPLINQKACMMGTISIPKPSQPCLLVHPASPVAHGFRMFVFFRMSSTSDSSPKPIFIQHHTSRRRSPRREKTAARLLGDVGQLHIARSERKHADACQAARKPFVQALELEQARVAPKLHQAFAGRACGRPAVLEAVVGAEVDEKTGVELENGSLVRPQGPEKAAEVFLDTKWFGW